MNKINQQLSTSESVIIRHVFDHGPQFIEQLFKTQPKTQSYSRSKVSHLSLFSKIYQKQKQLFQQSKRLSSQQAWKTQCGRNRSYLNYKSRMYDKFMSKPLQSSQLIDRTAQRISRIKTSVDYHQEIQPKSSLFQKYKTPSRIKESQLNESKQNKILNGIKIIRNQLKPLKKRCQVTMEKHRAFKKRLKELYQENQQFYSHNYLSQLQTDVICRLQPDKTWLQNPQFISLIDQNQAEAVRQRKQNFQYQQFKFSCKNKLNFKEQYSPIKKKLPQNSRIKNILLHNSWVNKQFRKTNRRVQRILSVGS